jgi:hypothetical protein
VDNSGFPLRAHGAGSVLPVDSPFMSAARRRNPQHFHRPRTGLVPFYTSDPHACAQPVGSPAAGLAAGSRPARRACVTRPARRTRGPGADEIVHEGGHRWPPPLYRTSGSCTHRCGPPSSRPATGLRPADPAPRPAANTPIDPARARLPTRRACTPPACALACLRSRRSRSRTPPVLGHDRG